jgi:hypothetical protein
MKGKVCFVFVCWNAGSLGAGQRRVEGASSAGAVASGKCSRGRVQ